MVTKWMSRISRRARSLARLNSTRASLFDAGDFNIGVAPVSRKPFVRQNEKRKMARGAPRRELQYKNKLKIADVPNHESYGAQQSLRTSARFAVRKVQPLAMPKIASDPLVAFTNPFRVSVWRSILKNECHAILNTVWFLFYKARCSGWCNGKVVVKDKKLRI